jgi:AcrR family transcriptional regulator
VSKTRKLILEKIYEAIRRVGYHGLRTDKVIEELTITKGAFYHYFSDKQSVGYAVVDEIIGPQQIEIWQSGLEKTTNALDAICNVIQSLMRCTCKGEVSLGCPLNNLSQEMSYIDEGFRSRFEQIIQTQIGLISNKLNEDKIGHKLDEAEFEPFARFILSSIEGSYSIAKILKDKNGFDQNMIQLQNYIQRFKTQ